jgi:biopolymer transport protein ExbB
MLELMQRGGPFMWVILTISIFSLGLIIERSYVLFVKLRLNAQSFYETIILYLEQDKMREAIDVCNVHSDQPLAEVLKAGLLNSTHSERDIFRSLESAVLKSMPKIVKRVHYLATCANVATLAGLLGTILGLIEAFRGVSQADAIMKQEILSRGIGVAMFTTAFGLCVALPTIIAHAILQNKQQALLHDIESSSTDLFNFLSIKNKLLTKD